MAEPHDMGDIQESASIGFDGGRQYPVEDSYQSAKVNEETTIPIVESIALDCFNSQIDPNGSVDLGEPTPSFSDSGDCIQDDYCVSSDFVFPEIAPRVTCTAHDVMSNSEKRKSIAGIKNLQVTLPDTGLVTLDISKRNVLGEQQDECHPRMDETAEGRANEIFISKVQVSSPEEEIQSKRSTPSLQAHELGYLSSKQETDDVVDHRGPVTFDLLRRLRERGLPEQLSNLRLWRIRKHKKSREFQRPLSLPENAQQRSPGPVLIICCWLAGFVLLISVVVLPIIWRTMEPQNLSGIRAKFHTMKYLSSRAYIHHTLSSLFRGTANKYNRIKIHCRYCISVYVQCSSTTIQISSRTLKSQHLSCATWTFNVIQSHMIYQSLLQMTQSKMVELNSLAMSDCSHAVKTASKIDQLHKILLAWCMKTVIYHSEGISSNEVHLFLLASVL